MYHLGLNVAAARYAIGAITSKELQEAADDALNQGVYSYSLGELATSSEPIMVVAGPLFEAALRELGISRPSKEHAVNLLLEHYVRSIAEERVAAYEGLERIVRELYYPVIEKEKVSRYAGDSRKIHHLLGAYYAYDDLSDRPDEVSYDGKFGREAVKALDHQVIELAREWNREHTCDRIDPSWLVWNNGTVMAFARSIQTESAFGQLPILADALEDVGCRNENILGHCRHAGKHFRCCWVVDIILAQGSLGV